MRRRSCRDEEGAGAGRAGAAHLKVQAAKSAMAKNSPVEFYQQVRAETAKVTWPTRRETLITTAMVFVMVFLASIFFLVVDQILRFGVSTLLTLGH